MDDLDQPIGKMLWALLTGKQIATDSTLTLDRLIVYRLKKNIAQLVAFVLILGGLSLIAYRVSDSAAVGKYFSIGLVGVLTVLLIASFVVLTSLKFFLSHTRLHLPSVVRHGLANLYRPGNPSAALLAALGMGVMQIMLVFLMQHAIVQQLQITLRSQPAEHLPRRHRGRRDRRHQEAVEGFTRRNRAAGAAAGGHRSRRRTERRPR